MKRLASALTLVLALSGCTVSNIAFREDERVDIVEPDDRSEVTLPVRIRWRSPGLDGRQFYAVFVDQEPVRPGQSLRALADDSCRQSEGCPDVQYFRDRYVFLTDDESVTLEAVPQQGSSQRTSVEDRHEATIVLIDADGRRNGEAAYSVEFTVED